MGHLWDTSAILAYYFQDDGRLDPFAEGAVTTANNLLEAYFQVFTGKLPAQRLSDLERLREPLVPLTASTARKAAELRMRHRDRGWSHIDAMTYAAALENGLTLVAVGEEFEGLEGAVALPPGRKRR